MLAAFARPAFAEPTSGESALAVELFDAGRDLMAKGDFAAACPKLAESAKLEPRVGTLAKLAECEEGRHQIAAARQHWEEAVALARATNDPRTKHAADELARVNAVVPRLQLSYGGDPPSGFAIRLDDMSLGAATLGVSVPVDPGRHHVSVGATDKETWSTDVDTKADGAVTLIAIPPLADKRTPTAAVATPPSSPAIASPAPHEQPPERTSTFPWRTVGVATAGIGVVGLGVGTVFAVVAKSKFDSSNAQPNGCVNNLCPKAAAQTRDDARSAGNIATVFVVAGGVLTAAGVTIWLVAPQDRSSKSAALAPAVGSNAAGLTVQGAW